MRTAGRYSEAIQDLDRAVQVDDRYAPAYYHRGIAWTKLCNWQNATNDLSRSIELSGGTDSDTHVALGEVHFATGDFALALVNFETAIELDGNPDALLGRVEVFLETNRIRDAIQACNTLTKSRHATAFALRGWGKMLLEE